MKFLEKIFGNKHSRDLKRMQPMVDRVNSLEKTVWRLSDHELRQRTTALRERAINGEPLDELLFEAFAVAREGSKRVLNMRHFDVQVIGGIVLHEGKIAEMKTGEGKTLVATLPVYLNALTGKGAHVVTVNDYLAQRDAAWMGKLYHFLGLSVGTIVHGLSDVQRKQNYGSDVTYGTNNEFGFDYLRDNMKFSLEHYVQREFNFGIVDEVDSILIDEARTPLIISGPAEESTDKYYKINEVVPGLRRDIDYSLDEKSRTASLSEEGVAKVEKRLSIDNLYEPNNMEILHHVHQALKAHLVFKKDVDYVVKDGQVIIVDEFTGRLMPGRRYSDGLHQALEAKENVKIERENQTLATITFQNYFRLYPKLAGMTGTAETEAEEFMKIYNLDVVVIPSNMPMVRTDHPDLIYRTEREKFNAVLDEIEELHAKGQPILVGTVSVDKSEKLSILLKKRKIRHHVLNAKHHAQEAEIIAAAGQPAAVTISTNMAGRGTDIVLGPGVPGFGGLHIIGTERHEARRIDNQLRGRSGRQGDPGSSRFYLSLEDDLMRIFASDRVSAIMQRLGMEEGVPIEHPLVTRAIESAQKRVEGHNFDIRKHLLKYDDVMNQQRKTIYLLRRRLLEGSDIATVIAEWFDTTIEDVVFQFVDEKLAPAEWDLDALRAAVKDQFALDFEPAPIEQGGKPDPGQLHDQLRTMILEQYQARVESVPDGFFHHLEKVLGLQNLDTLWKEHLGAMDHLKEGISLRGYAQKDPLLEYKKEGYNLFEDMYYRIQANTIRQLMTLRLRNEGGEQIELPRQRRQQPTQEVHGPQGTGPAQPQTVKRDQPKIGRNDPCHCGSGKKFKKCCGRNL
ncbi:MAG: preprotein translocase subunit SecA [Deltaproteobacteria bacterium RIFOXYA12_FULL_61_11]|nr:MAG: preprotein translocase subunit SecA [Deltaproteobacteria bacterium RIFOXYA12_FULL_61_11]